MIPTNAKASDIFYYVDQADVAEIMADPNFVPIQGSVPTAHGSLIGYINGRLVVTKRMLDDQ